MIDLCRHSTSRCSCSTLPSWSLDRTAPVCQISTSRGLERTSSKEYATRHTSTCVSSALPTCWDIAGMEWRHEEGVWPPCRSPRQRSIPPLDQYSSFGGATWHQHNESMTRSRDRCVKEWWGRTTSHRTSRRYVTRKGQPSWICPTRFIAFGFVGLSSNRSNQVQHRVQDIWPVFFEQLS